MLDKNLEQYGTPTQIKYYKAAEKYNSHRLAAKELGVSKSTITSAIMRMKKTAARRGYAPEQDMNTPTAEGYAVKGTSTLYDADGNVKIQWVKTNQDKEDRLQSMADALERLAEPFKSKSLVSAPPSNISSDLINVIPFGDPHIGLYTWNVETNNNFDTDIAENIMVSAVDHLIRSAPEADTALIINLGDFFHADTSAGITLRSGNKLDTDGRWGEILEVGIRIMRRCIDSALMRHNKVIVMNAIGNHDDHSTKMLSVVMREYYHNHPRVEIRGGDKVFLYEQFGKNLFGVTHGHTIKPNDLEGIMVRDCNDIWSNTTRRKWFIGHFHSQRVHDLRNCNVEYYRTLAPGDAWSVASGYRSDRDMRCETWHKDGGHVGTNIFDPIMML